MDIWMDGWMEMEGWMDGWLPSRTVQARCSQIGPFLVEVVVMNMVENLLASPPTLWGGQSFSN